jgi:hypothetical protein
MVKPRILPDVEFITSKLFCCVEFKCCVWEIIHHWFSWYYPIGLEKVRNAVTEDNVCLIGIWTWYVWNAGETRHPWLPVVVVQVGTLSGISQLISWVVAHDTWETTWIENYSHPMWDSRFFRCVHKNAKSITGFVVSVQPHRTSAPTGRIFMIFDIWVVFENLSRKFKFHQN